VKLATTVSSHFYCTCPQKDFVSTRHIAQSDSGLRNRDALQACTRGLVNHWDEIYFLQLALLGHLVVEGHCEGEARLRSEVIRQIVWEPLNATEFMTHCLGYDFFLNSYPIFIDFNNAIWDAQWDAHGKEDE